MRPQHKTIKRNQQKAKPRQAKSRQKGKQAPQTPPAAANVPAEAPLYGHNNWSIKLSRGGYIDQSQSQHQLPPDQVRSAMGREEKTCQTLRKMAKKGKSHMLWLQWRVACGISLGELEYVHLWNIVNSFHIIYHLCSWEVVRKPKAIVLVFS